MLPTTAVTAVVNDRDTAAAAGSYSATRVRGEYERDQPANRSPDFPRNSSVRRRRHGGPWLDDARASFGGSTGLGVDVGNGSTAAGANESSANPLDDDGPTTPFHVRRPHRWGMRRRQMIIRRYSSIAVGPTITIRSSPMSTAREKHGGPGRENGTRESMDRRSGACGRIGMASDVRVRVRVCKLAANRPTVERETVAPPDNPRTIMLIVITIIITSR